LPLSVEQLTAVARRWRRELRGVRNEYLLSRGMRRLRHPPWDDLVRGWSNSWSAEDEYLEAVAFYGRSAHGPVLECGSGLTTLVLAAVGADVWTIEHDPFWFRFVSDQLKRYGLQANVQIAPLRSYGSFDWYDVDPETFPVFSLVICDGPPGHTNGGRYGLLPVMQERLADNCTVLLDDTGREGERQLVTSWRERVASCDTRGKQKPYSILALRPATELTQALWPVATTSRSPSA
jgi:hypothetical protein